VQTQATPTPAGAPGHPRGLRVLFFTEMWERFSYYGMRALLVLYMTQPAARGGLGLDLKIAGILYGFYTFGVYAMSLPAGYAADRWFGHARAVRLGGGFIALGQFSLALGGRLSFFGGLVLIILGTGLLKTNCTTMVGQLYEEHDPRRDAAYSIYYMGINIGAFSAPLVLGFLAQNASFAGLLGRLGLATTLGWRVAFATAGVAMLAGLLQFQLNAGALGAVGQRPSRQERQRTGGARVPLTREEKLRMGVVGILFLFAILFFAVYEQAGSTLNLFADGHTRCQILGWTFPSSWLQSVPSLWVLILSAPFAALWMRLGSRNPSSPVKFAAGIFFVGLGMVVLVPALRIVAGGAKVGPFWLVLTYFLHTVGELCLSPVGLATTSRLAPRRYAALMMGVWIGSMALGNLLAGLAASFFGTLDPVPMFLLLFAVTTGGALGLLALAPMIRRMTGDLPTATRLEVQPSEA